MKTYRPPRTVVAEVKALIAADKPAPNRPSVLARIARLLCDSRNYQRTAIFLAAGGLEMPRAFSGSESGAGQRGPDLTVPIGIASHTLGSLRVQLAPDHVFNLEERVFLTDIADVLARYLSGKGKYLMRKAREALQQAAPANAGERRGYQPSSDRASSMETRRAAAGEKSRS